MTDEFAVLTPYQYASDEPIANIDLDGLEAAPILNVFKQGNEYVLVANKLVKPNVLSVGGAFFKGVGKDLWGAVKGTAHAVVHPVQTLSTLGALQQAGSPEQMMVGMAVYQKGQQTIQAFRTGNANVRAEIIGGAAGEVLQLFGGEIAEVGKVGEIGKLGELAGDLGKVVDATKVEEATKTVEEVAAAETGMNFTKSGFRGNLIKATGLNPGKASQAHHIFPQKFESIFSGKGINIHDPKFGAWWETTTHVKNASRYNAAWESFLRTNPSQSQIMNYGRQLMGQYGIPVGF